MSQIIETMDRLIEFYWDFGHETITKQELQEAVEKGWHDGNKDHINEAIALLDEIGEDKFELIEQVGGAGMGDNYWVVIKVGDKYYKNTTWYASHVGIGDWDGFKEVHPQEKTITEYV